MNLALNNCSWLTSKLPTGTDNINGHAGKSIFATCLAKSGIENQNESGSIGKTPFVKQEQKNLLLEQELGSQADLKDKKQPGEQGLEPRLTDPESVVLPLHYSPKTAPQRTPR